MAAFENILFVIVVLHCRLGRCPFVISIGGFLATQIQLHFILYHVRHCCPLFPRGLLAIAEHATTSISWQNLPLSIRARIFN